MSNSCNPMDCSPPGSSVHGILQARILEWVAISFSRESSWPREITHVSCIAGRWSGSLLLSHWGSPRTNFKDSAWPWNLLKGKKEEIILVNHWVRKSDSSPSPILCRFVDLGSFFRCYLVHAVSSQGYWKGSWRKVLVIRDLVFIPTSSI